MFNFYITSFSDVVKYESNVYYNTYDEAMVAGYDYLVTWESINDDRGLVKVIEI